MTAVSPDASQQAVVEAALVLLERMGLSPADLTAVPQARKPVPTFAEYVPLVSTAVSDGCRRAYGSYWNRVVGHWGGRRLDEPTPSAEREQAVAAFGITSGARVMLSTPPPITRSASPERFAQAAMAIASSPEPRNLFSVLPATRTGSSASSTAIRATLRLSSSEAKPCQQSSGLARSVRSPPY